MPDKFAVSLPHLIGFDTLDRPHESWYAFVARLIRANLLNQFDVRHQLPSEWVHSAFSPGEVPLAPLIESIKRYEPRVVDWEDKLSPEVWVLFPDLCNAPPECLRCCPSCLGEGFHSYAMQGDLVARCPVHDEALIHACPHCGVPLVWRAQTAAASAFQCPAGCVLMDTLWSGLDLPDHNHMTEALRAHKTYVGRFREIVTFVSGPLYVAYPPYLVVAPLRMPRLPSIGLIAALRESIATISQSLPPTLFFHAITHGDWVFEIARWKECERSSTAAHQLKAMRRLFRRGVYQTKIPIVNRAKIDGWLTDVQARYGKWGDAVLLEDDGGWVLVMASYRLINNELAALRRILARDLDPFIALVHYEDYLIRTLEDSLIRRAALDRVATPCLALQQTESFEGILAIDSGFWLVKARTQGNSLGQAAWEEFREPAELRKGEIHVTARYGPP